jgi:hypothetical protein
MRDTMKKTQNFGQFCRAHIKSFLQTPSINIDNLTQPQLQTFKGFTAKVNRIERLINELSLHDDPTDEQTEFLSLAKVSEGLEDFASAGFIRAGAYIDLNDKILDLMLNALTERSNSISSPHIH